MILLLALRSLLARPVRSAVLAGGFGLGVAVMAALLGIGGVILEQARTPALVGGALLLVGLPQAPDPNRAAPRPSAGCGRDASRPGEKMVSGTDATAVRPRQTRRPQTGLSAPQARPPDRPRTTMRH